MDRVEITIDGVTFSGNVEALKKVLKGVDLEKFVGGPGYYKSTSRGEYVKILSMASGHIRNAMLKMYHEWIDKLRNATTPQEFEQLITDGPSSREFLDMFAELNLRNRMGKDWSFRGR